MKHCGCVLEFARERNEELMRAYRRVIGECRQISVPELARRIVATPCTRYWVSEERATVVVGALLRGDWGVLDGMRASKRAMFKDIYGRVVAERKRDPGARVATLVSRVVYSPAPSFFMRARSAMELIYKVRREERKRKKGGEG